MLWYWDSLAKDGLHHAFRQGRVANMTDNPRINMTGSLRRFRLCYMAPNLRRSLSKSDAMRWQRPLPAYSCGFENDNRNHGKEITMNQSAQHETRNPMDELVDIREISVDKNLPKEERIAAFVRQIKNPYRFRCGEFVVNASFAGNGVTLEECLQGILR